MFYFLLALGLISMLSGVFVIAFGIPIRETTFGSALLVAGSVAIAGGFVTLGLAAAVAELRLVIQALKARMPAMPHPSRAIERKDAVERKDGEKRGGQPRLPIPPRPAAEPQPPAGSPMPPRAANREPPAAQPEMAPREAARRPEWLRRAFAEPSTAREPDGQAPLGPPEPHRNDLRTADGWPHPSNPSPPPADFPPARDAASLEPRRPQAPAQRKMIDMASRFGRGRRPGEETPPEKAPPEPPMRQPEPRPAPAMTPQPAPASPPRPDPRPPSVLKSGVIDEIAYTLFTDGSIEAQMPEGTTRFASIEEFREHLERHER